MGLHSRVSSSKLPALALCPGRLTAEEAVPQAERDQPTSASVRGDRDHALLAWRIQNPEAPWPVEVSDNDRTYPITGEDILAVNPLWNYVRIHPGYKPNAEQKQIPSQMWVEKKFEIGFHCKPQMERGLCTGTADLVLAWQDTLEVCDWKFGRYPVNPNNYQNKGYGIGAVREMIDETTGEFKPGFRQLRKLKLTIGQPTQEPVIRSIEFPLEAVGPWMQEIGHIAAKALAPNAPRIPGDSQCHFCAAKTTCPERLAKVSATMFEALEQGANSMQPQIPAPDPIKTTPIASVDQIQSLADQHLTQDLETMPNEQLGRLLDLALLVEGYFKEARELGHKRLEAGQSEGLGWKLIPGRNKREWISENEEELTAGLKNVGIKKDDQWVRTRVSPAQAEKCMAGLRGPQEPVASNPERMKKLEKLYRVTPGKPRMVPESDPTPAINDPGKMFQVVGNPTKPEECPWL